jgi:hypothetical protein
MRKWLLSTLLAASAGCGRIEGEVARGSDGSAIPAARVGVVIFADADGYMEFCRVVHEAAEAARTVRNRFADSIYRATRTTPDGPSQADKRMTFNIRNHAYGDPAKAIVARRDSALARLEEPHRAWSGRTNLDGTFRSDRLWPGKYVVEVAGIPNFVTVGVFGAERVQASYYGIEGDIGCPVTPGR